MSYCQNCGAERKYSAKICEYCGDSFEIFDNLNEKDQRINQLKYQLHQLESTPSFKTESPVNSDLKYFWIIAALMIIGFFGFIFFFVYQASN